VHCDDIVYALDINIYLSVNYVMNPSIVVTSNVFVVTIVNPCVPPPLCINIPGCGLPPPVVNPPTIDIDITVTVTVEVNIELPTWNCGNVGCNTQIIPVCVDCNIGGGAAVAVIINNTININISSCVGICGTGPEGQVHVIYI
jgi:hypothetical protein